MKRSEMVEKVNDKLNKKKIILPGGLQLESTPIIVEKFLNLFEEEGMKPPTITHDMMHFGFPSNRWEEE